MSPDLSMRMWLGAAHHFAFIFKKRDAAIAVHQLPLLISLLAKYGFYFCGRLVAKDSVLSIKKTNDPALALGGFFPNERGHWQVCDSLDFSGRR